MRKALVAFLALLAGLLVLSVAACGGGEEGQEPAQQEEQAGGGEGEAAPIKLGFSTWIGYGPLWIADEKGFFDEEGVDVEITIIEDPVQRFNALKAERLDAVASTIDTYARTVAKGIPSVQVLALDASTGGDGIVAEKDIGAVHELKGKKVAVSEGSVSEFFLAYVLERHGLKLDDVERVNLTSGDAGAAFAAGKVPVAVTWEPWLTRAEKNPNGHVLVSSSEYPDIIVDTLAFRKDFAEENPESIRALVRAYDRAVRFIDTNADEANEIMAEKMGMKPDEVPALLEGVKLFTIPENRKFFGTDEEPGRIADVFDAASEFWTATGEIDEPVEASTAIDPSFVHEHEG